MVLTTSIKRLRFFTLIYVSIHSKLHIYAGNTQVEKCTVCELILYTKLILELCLQYYVVTVGSLAVNSAFFIVIVWAYFCNAIVLSIIFITVCNFYVDCINNSYFSTALSTVCTKYA
jgi:hypothetical protein